MAEPWQAGKGGHPSRGTPADKRRNPRQRAAEQAAHQTRKRQPPTRGRTRKGGK